MFSWQALGAHQIALAYMEGLDCPRSVTVAILIRYEEWDQLTSLEVVPSHYTSPDSYRRAALATEFLRKFEHFPLELDLDQATFDKWRWAEQECFRTNRKLYELLDMGTLGGVPITEPQLSFLEGVRKNVVQAIGVRPPGDFDGRYGPGATVSDASGFTTVPDKMASTPTLTPEAWLHVRAFAATAWGRACTALGRTLKSTRGNGYFTVPKDSRILRPCAKEPSLNGFYQLGIGKVMRSRLKRIGIDLDDGQEIHRQVACEASVRGHMATIDLRSASDTVAQALVKLLLPPKWYALLESLRSPFTSVKGKWWRLEKFSSMGNGFTFELETTLFWSIARACCPKGKVYVYGDDLIVPADYASDVVAALSWFGFTANPKKTFLKGSFRESCGGDYFLGQPVRAHYLKESPDEPHKLISLANGIRRVALQDPTGQLWRDLRPAWFACLDKIPTCIRRCRGPQALGDIVIHDDERYWDVRWRGQIRYVRVWRPTFVGSVRFGGFAYCVQFAAALYGVATQAGGTGRVSDDTRIVARGDVASYKVGWAAFS